MNKISIQILDNYQYKKAFLPYIDEQNLLNKSKIQIYRIENYLKGIVMPVLPYRTTFNFLIFLTKGNLLQDIDNQSYQLEKDNVVNIKQGNITRTLSLSNDVEGFFIVYENEILTDIFLVNNNLKYSMLNPHTKLNENHSSWIQKALILLEEETINNEDSKMSISIALFQSILLKIFQTNSTTDIPFNRQTDITYHFREFVNKHHVEHKNVLFYANMLNVSENYLYKCIKETTGKSPKQWINEIGILHSQILLQDTTRDIASIAFELRYDSPSYFTRLFKKITGFAPSSYRREKSLL